MTLRVDPELRAAIDRVRSHNREKRKNRLAAKAVAIRAVKESFAPNKREPREREPGYLQWLRRLPCAVCGSTPCDAAHLRFSNFAAGRVNPGGQNKSHDRFANPLCRQHHAEQHDAKEQAWWASHGIDPDDLCRALYAAFLAGQDGAEVIARFQPSAAALRGDPRTARHQNQSAAHEAPAVIRRKGE